MNPQKPAAFPPRIWVAEDGFYRNGEQRWGCLDLKPGVSAPGYGFVYIPEALAEQREREARAKAFEEAATACSNLALGEGSALRLEGIRKCQKELKAKAARERAGEERGG
jgi:hypothetical protein